jgi:cell division protease FtsH
VEREVIFADDVEKIFGKRPWTSRAEELIEAQQRAEAEAMAERRGKELEAEAQKAKALEAQPSSDHPDNQEHAENDETK